MICEVCGRDSELVARAALRSYQELGGAMMFPGMPNPFPGPLPQGEGWGWCVVFDPARRWFAGPGASFLFAGARQLHDLTYYRILTCGEPMCIWRARAMGVPGKFQAAGVPEIDAWNLAHP